MSSRKPALALFSLLSILLVSKAFGNEKLISAKDLLNDDGSISFFDLQIEDETGNIFYLDADLSAPLCQRLGFNSTVVISKGQLSEQSSLRIKVMAKDGTISETFDNQYISYLICRPAHVTREPSKRYTSIKTDRDAGIVTIDTPLFKMGDLKFGELHFYFHENSNSDGICDLFGFGKAVRHQLGSHYCNQVIMPPKVILDKNGYFQSHRNSSQYIWQISCELIDDKLNDDEISKATTDLLQTTTPVKKKRCSLQ